MRRRTLVLRLGALLLFASCALPGPRKTETDAYSEYPPIDPADEWLDDEESV